MTTRSFIVGHNDRSIKYTSGYWIEFVDESGSSSHFTTDKPATAVFEFDGTMISILGTFKVDGTGANTSLLYTLDGRDDRSFPLKSIGPPPSHSLYLSPWLSQGRHTLVLALSGRAALFIDGMNVTTGSTLKGPANATHERRHIGAIVGGTLGGVVFIVLLCLFFLVYRRHRHRKARPTAAIYVMGPLQASLPASKEAFTSPKYSHYGISFSPAIPSADSLTTLPPKSHTRRQRESIPIVVTP